MGRSKQIGRYYRLNLNIAAKKVRLIDKESKQIGVVDIEEARKRSRQEGLDLVEIAPKANPPVVRIIDFKKFKYEESKKERTNKKKTKEVGTKEVWLGPLISEHDMKVRTQQARTFLESGNRVKLTVKFGGREIAHPEFGYKVLDKVSNMLADCSEPDSQPKFVGRNLNLSLKPIKK